MVNFTPMLFCLWASRLLWCVNIRLPLYVTSSYRKDVCGQLPRRFFWDCFGRRSLPCGSLLCDLALQECPLKASPPSPVLTCLGVEVNPLAITLLVTPERL